MTKALSHTPRAAQNHCWTDELANTDHVRFFLSRDWTKSPLGPLEHWSTTLQLFTRMVFADARAACVWWGPDLVAIYNEAYVPLAAATHPKLMGATFITGFPDLYANIRPFFDQCRDTGVGVKYSSAMSLIVERKGWREEAFFTGNFVPIGGTKATEPEGYYNSLMEVTTQRLSDRRTTMLNRMASVPEVTSTSVSAHILATLETNPRDIPMAMLYEVVEESNGGTVLRLRGHFGLPEGHRLIVDGQALESQDGLIPDCRRAKAELLVIDCDERFDSVSWQGFGTPPKEIAVLPIMLASRVFGYLIVGTNPYRRLDDGCTQFLKDIARMASSIISATISHDESQKRQKQLEEDLAFSDMKLRHLIEHASVGMCHVSMEGETMWANDCYYALYNTTAEEQRSPKAFLSIYHPDDVHKVEEIWHKLVSGINITLELKLKRLYTSPIGDVMPAQVQVSAFPYRENGEVKGVMGCITDISRIKWAQNFQARLAEEAREAKRQQEAFIDVVSHEMRNPLSAIVHCADSISHCLDEVRTRLEEIPEPCLDALAENIASADVIMQCANHQKRIIDDVLTLSKLDSMLLSITPSAVNPSKLLASITNIFDAEFKASSIKCWIEADASFKALNIDYLCLDPSRVTQVFINLITNAVKFVQSSANPEISIRYGATLALSNPKLFFPESMFWATKNHQVKDATLTPDWGTGEEIYLTFTVKDTGIGMREKEVSKIFERFRQASAKTHVRYGGSGLGLFISKELTERQGGEIGVSSVWGEGSTFGFYIKTRRVDRRPESLRELYLKNGRAVVTTEDSTGDGHEEEEKDSQIQVLLVEDNIINQQVLSKQLRKAGCVVDVANHGLEALSKLETNAFEVVLMDLEMPVMDGLTAIGEIRKRQKEGKVVDPLPIIAVTANVRKEQIDTAIAAGANRVMQKPFKAADLVYMMKGLVPQISTPDLDSVNPVIKTPGLRESTAGDSLS